MVDVCGLLSTARACVRSCQLGGGVHGYGWCVHGAAYATLSLASVGWAIAWHNLDRQRASLRHRRPMCDHCCGPRSEATRAHTQTCSPVGKQTALRVLTLLRPILSMHASVQHASSIATRRRLPAYGDARPAIATIAAQHAYVPYASTTLRTDAASRLRLVEHLDSLDAHQLGELARVEVVLVGHVGERLLAAAYGLELGDADA